MNESIMRQLGFGKQVNAVHESKCPTCFNFIDPDGFKDEWQYLCNSVRGFNYV